jgi:hypothetical protein
MLESGDDESVTTYTDDCLLSLMARLRTPDRNYQYGFVKLAHSVTTLFIALALRSVWRSAWSFLGWRFSKEIPDPCGAGLVIFRHIPCHFLARIQKLHRFNGIQ